MTTDLLVVGAGPTGLAAACDALRHGLTVRVVERRSSRSLNSKALVLHAGTMEVLERIGCAKQMVAAGQQFRALNVRTSACTAPLRIDLLNRRWGDTRYPFWLSLPQYEVERILEERLEALGGAVDWSVALVSLEDRGDEVVSMLAAKAAGAAATEHRARWVLGCDGGHSTVRELAGLTLGRDGLGTTFALADVHTAWQHRHHFGPVLTSFLTPFSQPKSMSRHTRRAIRSTVRSGHAGVWC